MYQPIHLDASKNEIESTSILSNDNNITHSSRNNTRSAGGRDGDENDEFINNGFRRSKAMEDINDDEESMKKSRRKVLLYMSCCFAFILLIFLVPAVLGSSSSLSSDTEVYEKDTLKGNQDKKKNHNKGVNDPTNMETVEDSSSNSGNITSAEEEGEYEEYVSYFCFLLKM